MSKFDENNDCSFSQFIYRSLTHHLYPCHSRPPQACLPVMAPQYRGLTSLLHCSRWRHSLWDSSSNVESLKRQHEKTMKVSLAPSAGRSPLLTCTMFTWVHGFLSTQKRIGTHNVDKTSWAFLYFIHQERQIMELVLNTHF